MKIEAKTELKFKTFEIDNLNKRSLQINTTIRPIIGGFMKRQLTHLVLSATVIALFGSIASPAFSAVTEAGKDRSAKTEAERKAEQDKLEAARKETGGKTSADVSSDIKAKLQQQKVAAAVKRIKEDIAAHPQAPDALAAQGILREFDHIDQLTAEEQIAVKDAINALAHESHGDFKSQLVALANKKGLDYKKIEEECGK